MAASVTEEARRQANLKLLQRTCDASIQDILQTATHVVLYEFKNNTWAKCGVEGSSFLVACATASVKLVILNRHSANNFVMEVTAALKVQEQDPFLISQEAHIPRTSGIWFHSADERLAMTRQLQSTIAQLAAGTFAFPAAPAAAAPLAAPAPAPKEVTQDERDHLAALLSQTALAAGGVGEGGAGAAASTPRSHSAPKSALTPMANASPSPAATGASSSVVALDKKALQLTLLSLIQDERFLDLLHSQYLRVVHARSKKNNNDS